MKNLRTGPLLPQSVTQRGLRFNQDAAPALMLQQPRLRASLGIIGADLDKETVCLLLEILPDQPLFERLRLSGRFTHAICAIQCLGSVGSGLANVQSCRQSRSAGCANQVVCPVG